jgi:hypothetical protein
MNLTAKFENLGESTVAEYLAKGVYSRDGSEEFARAWLAGKIASRKEASSAEQRRIALSAKNAA